MKTEDLNDITKWEENLNNNLAQFLVNFKIIFFS